nr:unnamed protein product [Digitaria exilis]
MKVVDDPGKRVVICLPRTAHLKFTTHEATAPRRSSPDYKLQISDGPAPTHLVCSIIIWISHYHTTRHGRRFRLLLALTALLPIPSCRITSEKPTNLPASDRRARGTFLSRPRGDAIRPPAYHCCSNNPANRDVVTY